MLNINAKSFLINYTDILIEKKLGQGGFGDVYKGVWYGTPVAVKKLLDEDDLSTDAKEEFIKEAEIMANLKAPNIVQYFGFCTTPNYSIVMEYMPKGSLYSVNKTEAPMPWSIRMRIASDMANGILFLNNKGILHRDIKSLNVLLDEAYKAKLCDFGLARVKTETKNNTTAKNTNRDCVGTVQWMAPELFEINPKYTTKSDIYSLGITFWELASRRLPYSKVDRHVIPSIVMRGQRENVPEECPEEMAQLIKECWDTEPSKRPDARSIVNRLNETAQSLIKSEFEALDKEVKDSNYTSIQWFYNSTSKTYWIGKCSEKAIIYQKQDGMLTSPDSINEYKEYIAIKIYSLFGVTTPDVLLHKQIISNKAQATFKMVFEEHKKIYGKLPSGVPDINEPRLHLMLSCVDGFKALKNNFIDFYQKQSKTEYCKIEGVPLKGFGRALAVATYLYDFDFIGSSGDHVGYVLKGSYAQIVKINARESMSFVDDLSKELKPTEAGKTKIGYLDLNKEDQKEFAMTVIEIIESSNDQFSNLFQMAIFYNKNFEKVLKHLQQRKSSFFNGFPLEVKELVKNQIFHFQKLLENLENNNNDNHRTERAIFNNDRYIKQSIEYNVLSYKKIEVYGCWAIRMRRLFNEEVVCGFGDGTYKIFNINSGKCVKSVSAHTGRVWDCQVFQNKYLATCSQDKSIRFWDNLGRGDCVKTIKNDYDVISVCDIYKNQFATADSGSKVTIWDFSTEKIIHVLKGHTNVVQCLVYIPEKNILASSAGDAVVIVWTLDNYKPLYKLTGHTKLIYDLRKLNNNFLISSCDDYTAKIWDTFSGKCVLTLTGHNHFVNGTSQLSNGNIVTSSEDETMKIWNHITGECLQTISCHRKPVWGMETYDLFVDGNNQINILSGDTIGEIFFTKIKISSKSK